MTENDKVRRKTDRHVDQGNRLFGLATLHVSALKNFFDETAKFLRHVDVRSFVIRGTPSASKFGCGIPSRVPEQHNERCD